MCASHASAGVCHRSGCGVTLTNPRSKFCSAACRQAAHRQSPAYAARLATLRTARKLRRETHFRFKHRASSFHQYRGYGGPVPAGMPARCGGLDLKPFLRQAVANA
jgi:hypothetical protein